MKKFTFLNNNSSLTIILFLFFWGCGFISAQTPAFPGAEGYGQFVTGGRGGAVLEVTNLDDSGPGSFRAAAEASGKRTIVFRVSGNISLNSIVRIKNGDVTIAGQTAPGDGICIKDYPVRVDANNVIIRYMRFRLGDINRVEDDATWGRDKFNIILDHCSISWSIDECASYYDNVNFTMQWCIISESLYHSYHSKGDHGYGGIWGGWGATFHHNLIAHHTSRTPRFNGSRYTNKPENEIVDFVNNVIYNWGFNSAYGGEGGSHNIRLNYYKYGPATKSGVRNRIVEPYDSTGKWYVKDNFIYDYPEVTEDNWNGGVQGGQTEYQKSKMITEPFPISLVATQTPEEAFELVLDNTGANFPKRDSVDLRIVEETRTGTAQYGNSYDGGKNGIIDSQNDVGGWPELNSLSAPVDTDHDGMPDAWELANGLDPNNLEDGNNVRFDGYTMFEVYLEDLLNGYVTSVDSEQELSVDFVLNQNYPNPFNPSTKITFTIPDINGASNTSTTLRVYDVLGREIVTLINQTLPSGKYSVDFNSSNLTNDGYSLTSGVYFYKLTFMNFSQIKKMLLVK